MAVIPSFV